jgi:hypothetical protein
MTSRRALHLQKHLEPRISTEFGIEIDGSDEDEKNAFGSIRCSVEVASKMIC